MFCTEWLLICERFQFCIFSDFSLVLHWRFQIEVLENYLFIQQKFKASYSSGTNLTMATKIPDPLDHINL